MHQVIDFQFQKCFPRITIAHNKTELFKRRQGLKRRTLKEAGEEEEGDGDEKDEEIFMPTIRNNNKVPPQQELFALLKSRANNYQHHVWHSSFPFSPNLKRSYLSRLDEILRSIGCKSYQSAPCTIFLSSFSRFE
jgi:hypothetical protein